MSVVDVTRGESELTDAEIVASAKAHHLWLNAIACVRPSDEFCLGLGRTIVEMLNTSDIHGDMLGVHIGRVLYVRLNKS